MEATPCSLCAADGRHVLLSSRDEMEAHAEQHAEPNLQTAAVHPDASSKSDAVAADADATTGHSTDSTPAAAQDSPISAAETKPTGGTDADAAKQTAAEAPVDPIKIGEGGRLECGLCAVAGNDAWFSDRETMDAHLGEFHYGTPAAKLTQPLPGKRRRHWKSTNSKAPVPPLDEATLQPHVLFAHYTDALLRKEVVCVLNGEVVVDAEAHAIGHLPPSSEKCPRCFFQANPSDLYRHFDQRHGFTSKLLRNNFVLRRSQQLLELITACADIRPPSEIEFDRLLSERLLNYQEIAPLVGGWNCAVCVGSKWEVRPTAVQIRVHIHQAHFRDQLPYKCTVCSNDVASLLHNHEETPFSEEAPVFADLREERLDPTRLARCIESCFPPLQPPRKATPDPPLEFTKEERQIPRLLREASLRLLGAYVERGQGTTDIKCRLCDISFSPGISVRSIETHIHTHYSVPLFYCNECLSAFQMDGMEKHNRTWHRGNESKGGRWANLSKAADLRKLLDIHLECFPLPTPLPQDQVDKTFCRSIVDEVLPEVSATRKALLTSVEDALLLEGADLERLGPVDCELCDVRRLRPTILRKHIAHHIDDKMYSCLRCGTTSKLMISHMRTAHADTTRILDFFIRECRRLAALCFPRLVKASTTLPPPTSSHKLHRQPRSRTQGGPHTSSANSTLGNNRKRKSEQDESGSSRLSVKCDLRKPSPDKPRKLRKIAPKPPSVKVSEEPQPRLWMTPDMIQAAWAGNDAAAILVPPADSADNSFVPPIQLIDDEPQPESPKKKAEAPKVKPVPRKSVLGSAFVPWDVKLLACQAKGRREPNPRHRTRKMWTNPHPQIIELRVSKRLPAARQPKDPRPMASQVTAVPVPPKTRKRQRKAEEEPSSPASPVKAPTVQPTTRPRDAPTWPMKNVSVTVVRLSDTDAGLVDVGHSKPPPILSSNAALKVIHNSKNKWRQNQDQPKVSTRHDSPSILNSAPMPPPPTSKPVKKRLRELVEVVSLSSDDEESTCPPSTITLASSKASGVAVKATPFAEEDDEVELVEEFARSEILLLDPEDTKVLAGSFAATAIPAGADTSSRLASPPPVLSSTFIEPQLIQLAATPTQTEPHQEQVKGWTIALASTSSQQAPPNTPAPEAELDSPTNLTLVEPKIETESTVPSPPTEPKDSKPIQAVVPMARIGPPSPAPSPSLTDDVQRRRDLLAAASANIENGPAFAQLLRGLLETPAARVKTEQTEPPAKEQAEPPTKVAPGRPALVLLGKAPLRLLQLLGELAERALPLAVLGRLACAACDERLSFVGSAEGAEVVEGHLGAVHSDGRPLGRCRNCGEMLRDAFRRHDCSKPEDGIRIKDFRASREDELIEIVERIFSDARNDPLFLPKKLSEEGDDIMEVGCFSQRTQPSVQIKEEHDNVETIC